MKTDEKKKNRKINFEVKRVYVGKKPIGEVFEEVIEHSDWTHCRKKFRKYKRRKTNASVINSWIYRSILV